MSKFDPIQKIQDEFCTYSRSSHPIEVSTNDFIKLVWESLNTKLFLYVHAYTILVESNHDNMDTM